MAAQAALARVWTRRAVLFSLPVLSLRARAGKGQVFPAEWVRYADPSTEFPVYRFTSLEHASYLPAWYGRAVSRSNAFLIFWSGRSGRPQAYRVERTTGEIRQLTEAGALDGLSLTLAPNDRDLYYFDGPSLRQVSLKNLREKEIYRVPDGWICRTGISLSRDGSHAVLVEAQGPSSRLRLLRIGKRSATTILEGPAQVTEPLPRPRRESILYRQGTHSLWMAGYDGRENRRLPVAAGAIGPAFWSGDGKTVLYLHSPEDPRQLNAIRECNPETGTDGLVAVTSQFVHFAANEDGSVFVGASRNKASPHILLVLRSSRRELTICEHHASDPLTVDPVFSPDSQWVYFQSDREGKPAIYGMPVDKLVEPTGSR